MGLEIKENDTLCCSNLDFIEKEHVGKIRYKKSTELTKWGKIYIKKT